MYITYFTYTLSQRTDKIATPLIYFGPAFYLLYLLYLYIVGNEP